RRLADELREVAAEPLGDERAAKLPRLVERLVRPRDRQLSLHDARSRDSEDAPQVLLRPEGAVLAGARARHSRRLAPRGCVGSRARGPGDGVLEHAWNRAVVLGRDEEDCVSGRDPLAELGDGRECAALQISVVERELAEAVEELDLHAYWGVLACSPRESR